MKKIKLLLLLLFGIFLSSCSLFPEAPPTDAKVLYIEVNYDSISSPFELDDFELSLIKIRVFYDNDTTELLNLDESMLDILDISELFQVGLHDVRVVYKGKITSFRIEVINSSAAKEVEVLFILDGEQHHKMTLLKGQTLSELPEPPEKEGYNFLGWFFDDEMLTLNKPITEDLIVHAIFEEKREFTTIVYFYFDDNLDYLLDQIIVNHGQTVDEVVEIESSDYEFDGWYNYETDEEFDFSEPLYEESIILYAKWIKYETIKINFFLDKGLEPEFTDYTEDGYVQIPYDPDKEGYNFIGWYTVDDEEFDFYNIKITEDLNLYAKWEEKQYYNVSFSLNYDESLEPELVFVEENTLLKKPEGPKREGYTFSGWFTEENEEFNFNIPIEQDLTLYAKWEKVTYTITLDYNYDNLTMPLTVEYNDTFKRPDDLDREHYIFLGWYTEDDEEFDFNIEINKDLTLYAKWETVKYTITYFINGEIYEEPEEFAYGEQIIYKNYPTTVTGHTFNYWGGAMYVNMPGMDIEVHANLTPIKIQVTFRIDNKYIDQQVDYGTDAVPPKVEEKRGYDFVGWDEDYTNVTEEIIVNAIFKVKTFTLSFITNGDEDYDDIVVDYGTTAYFEIPTKHEHRFLGWYIGDEKQAMNKSFYFNHLEDITLEARWQINSYYIVYYLNEMTHKEKEYFEYGSPISLLEYEEKKGHTFSGWSVSGGGEFPETMPGKNLTIKGTETVNRYTIKYYVNNRLEGDQEVHDYGSPVELKGEPFIPDGYEFSGWSGWGEGAFPETMPDYDLEIHGLRIRLEFSIKFYNVEGELLHSQLAYKDDKLDDCRFDIEGYSFDGYYVDDEKISIYTARVESDLIVVLKWRPNIYKITYSSDDWAFNYSYYTYGEELILSDLVPDKEGYQFEGWYFEDDLEPFAEESILSDIILDAKWSILSFLLTRYVFDELYEEPTYYEYSESFANDIPVVEGHQFKGWHDNPEFEGEKYSKMPSRDLVLYAHFTPNLYVVRFYDFDGQSKDFQYIYYGQPATPPKLDPIPGYEFEGWDADYTFIKDTIEIRPIYKQIIYKAHFDSDGLEEIKTIDAYYEERLSWPVLYKPGHEFLGWVLDLQDYRLIYKEGYIFNFTEDKTFYALFTNEFEIHLQDQRPWPYDSIEVKYGDLVTLPFLEKDGYGFEGWYLDGELLDYEFIYTYEHSITIEEKWLDLYPDFQLEYHRGYYKVVNYIGDSEHVELPLTKEDIEIRYIGQDAFKGNNNVVSINLHEGIEEIDSGAFNDMLNLREIKFLKSGITLPNNILLGSNNLEFIAVSTTKNLKDLFGGTEESIPDSLTTVKLVTMEYSGIINGPMKDVIVEIADVEDFATYLFNNNEYVKVIVIPNTVKTVSLTRFYTMPNLKEVRFKENSTLNIIEEDAFKKASSLEKLIVPKSVTTIEEYAFEETGDLTIIFEEGSLLQTIGQKAFYRSGIKQIAIPKSVTTIGEYAFEDTPNLQTVIFEENSALEIINKGLFYNSNIQSIIIPNTIIEIEEKAFQGSNLSEILFEENSLLEIIGKQVFFNVVNLTHIDIPNSVVIIKEYAFSSTGLEKIIFDENSKLEHLETHAFNRAQALQEIVLPNSLQTIGQYAFKNVVPTKFSTPFFGSSRESTSDRGFDYLFDWWDYAKTIDEVKITGIDELESNYFGNSLVFIGGFVVTSNLKYIGSNIFSNTNYDFKTLVFEEGVEYIEDNAFKGLKYVEEIILPRSLKYIGYKAFSGLTNLETLIFLDGDEILVSDDFAFFEATNLKTLILPSNLEVISKGMFSGVKNLEILTIPKTVKVIEDNAFSNINSLTDLIFEEGTQIQSLGDYSFSVPKNLKELILPDSLLEIGEGAFLGAESVETLYIPFVGNKLGEDKDINHLGHLFGYPLGSGMYSIPFGNYNLGDTSLPYSLKTVNVTVEDFISRIAFYNAIAIEEINYLQGISTIGEEALALTKALKEFTISSNTISIDNKAFYDSGVEKIIFAENSLIETIAEDAFGKTENLKGFIIKGVHPLFSVEDGVLFNTNKTVLLNYPISKEGKVYQIPDAVIEIDPYSFAFNKNLEQITLSEQSSLDTIKEYAFYQSNLKTLVFDEYAVLSHIGAYAFSEIVTLKEIVIPNSVQTLGEYVFKGTIPTTMSIPFVGSSREATGHNQSMKYLFERKGNNDVIAEFRVTGMETLGAFYLGGLGEIIEKLVITSNVKNIGGYVTSGIKVLEFEEGIENIGSDAFKGLKDIEELIIPSSVTNIDREAFSGLTSLETLIFLDGIEALTVGNNVFAGAINLTTLVLPSNLDEIGAGMFFESESLKTINIPKDVTRIKDYAFYRSGIEQVILPEDSQLWFIYPRAFYEAENFTEFILEGESYYIFVEDGVLFHTLREELIAYPNNKEGDSYEVPNHVKRIGEYAFAFNQNLKTVTFEEDSLLSYIYAYAFYDTQIETIILPEGLNNIDEYAFSNNLNLTTLLIPSTVETIKEKITEGSLNLNIYLNLDEININWYPNWNTDDLPIYFKEEWILNEDGIPVLILED